MNNRGYLSFSAVLILASLFLLYGPPTFSGQARDSLAQGDSFEMLMNSDKPREPREPRVAPHGASANDVALLNQKLREQSEEQSEALRVINENLKVLSAQMQKRSADITELVSRVTELESRDSSSKVINARLSALERALQAMDDAAGEKPDEASDLVALGARLDALESSAKPKGDTNYFNARLAALESAFKALKEVKHVSVEDRARAVKEAIVRPIEEARKPTLPLPPLEGPYLHPDSLPRSERMLVRAQVLAELGLKDDDETWDNHGDKLGRLINEAELRYAARNVTLDAAGKVMVESCKRLIDQKGGVCERKDRHGNFCLDQDLLNAVAEKDCLMYSVGIADYMGSDLEIGKLGCEVHSFDPTVKHPEHPGEGVTFHHWGLRGSRQASLSNERLAKKKFLVSVTDEKISGITGEMLTLAEVRKRLGHEGRKITLLKLDCEGCEWGVLEDLMTEFEEAGNKPTVDQMMVEYHFQRGIGIDSYHEDMPYFLTAERLASTYFDPVFVTPHGTALRDARVIPELGLCLKSANQLLEITYKAK